MCVWLGSGERASWIHGVSVGSMWGDGGGRVGRVGGWGLSQKGWGRRAKGRGWSEGLGGVCVWVATFPESGGVCGG